MKVLQFHICLQNARNRFFAVYMAGSTERAEVYLKKLLSLLVAKRKLKSTADSAKLEYSVLVNVIVKEIKNEFLLCQKDTERLQAFPCKFNGGTGQFMNLGNAVKTVLLFPMDRIRLNEVVVPTESSWIKTC